MAVTLFNRNFMPFLAILAVLLSQSLLLSSGQVVSRRPVGNTRNRIGDKSPSLKDAFYEDNSFLVRIRTTYNHTASITCNGILMEDHLVLSDVTCIKYQGMANIDAKYVQVLSGELNNESVYEVDQIFLNKADPRDPGTELALLRLSRPLKADSECRQLIKPEKNFSIELETPVRTIGFTTSYELKENRSKVSRKNQASKYVCTAPGDLNETPGSSLLKGAPLLHMVDCRQYQLVGIYTKMEVVIDSQPPANKKHQDCFVLISTQIKWYEQVKSLASLGAKNDGASTQPSVIVVDVDEQQEEAMKSPTSSSASS